MTKNSVVFAGLLALGGIARAQDAPPPDPEATKLLAELKRGEPARLRPAADGLRARGGKAAAEAEKVLRDLEGRRRREWESAVARIRGLSARIGDGKALDPAREAWEKARAHANEWLFDSVKFPLPKVQPVDGPEEGYPQAKARGDAAMSAYKVLEPALDAAAGPAVALSAYPGQGARLRQALAAAIAAHGPVVALLPAEPSAQVDGPSLSAAEEFVLAVAEGDFAAAEGLYRRVPSGWQRLAAFHVYGRAIMARNTREACGMDKMPIRGLESINTYRMALGITPLWHNAKLAAMAQQHADEQMQKGYFSHTSPVPEYATMWDRARKANYGANVTECISTAGTASSAIEMWKWDGGHHRGMIHWEWTEVGCSGRGPSTLNPGAGETGSPPGLRY